MPVDDAVIDSLIQTESGGNASAVGAAGEIGLGQIKPSTAAQYGIPTESLWHPETNRAAVKIILNHLMDRYRGDLSKALAAYKAGPGNVDKGNITPASRDYVSGILARLPRGEQQPEQGGRGIVNAPVPITAPVVARAPSRSAGIERWAGFAPQPRPRPQAVASIPMPPRPGGLPGLATTNLPRLPNIKPRITGPGGRRGIVDRLVDHLDSRMKITLSSMRILPDPEAEMFADEYANVYRRYPDALVPKVQPLIQLSQAGEYVPDDVVAKEADRVIATDEPLWRAALQQWVSRQAHGQLG